MDNWVPPLNQAVKIQKKATSDSSFYRHAPVDTYLSSFTKIALDGAIPIATSSQHLSVFAPPNLCDGATVLINNVPPSIQNTSLILTVTILSFI